MHTNTTEALKSNFMSSFLLCAVFFLKIHSSFTLEIYNLHNINKDPERFSFHIFGLKCCLHHCYHVKAVQDDISTKTVPISLHHTVVEDVIFQSSLRKFQRNSIIA